VRKSGGSAENRGTRTNDRERESVSDRRREKRGNESEDCPFCDIVKLFHLETRETRPRIFTDSRAMFPSLLPLSLPGRPASENANDARRDRSAPTKTAFQLNSGTKSVERDAAGVEGRVECAREVSSC